MTDGGVNTENTKVNKKVQDTIVTDLTFKLGCQSIIDDMVDLVLRGG